MNLSSYFKVIQIFLWQNIALCVNDLTFWKHHVTLDQIIRKSSHITERRWYNSSSESDDKYIALEIEPSRQKKADVKTMENTEISDHSSESTIISESNSDFEDSYNTEDVQATLNIARPIFDQHLRAESVIDRTKELTTALMSQVTLFKATTTQKPLTKIHKLKNVKIAEKSTPNYTKRSTERIHGRTSKKDLTEFVTLGVTKNKWASYSRSTHVQNVNDIQFLAHKRKKQKAHLRSKKNDKVKKVIGSNNQTVKKQQMESVANLEYFHPHVISKQLDCLAKKWDSKVRINQEVIGRTYQYNDIVMWKLRELSDCRFKRAADDKFVDEEPQKKIILIVHGLSVMGWSKRTCFRDIAAFETLLSYYVDNLDAFDIFLIPMANPDGVMKVNEFAMWNKNVSPQSACPGVNVDRNFDVAWGDKLNVSSCSQLYPGPLPFSEQESSAVYKVFHKYGTKIIGYFHFHAGEYNANTLKGDAVLYPNGYTAVQDDDDRYVDLENEIDEALKNMTFRALSVSVDTLYDWYGRISGSSVDYASKSFGIPYSLELVLQLYNTYEQQDAALTEVWQNVLDVIFDHIARSQAVIDDNEN